MTADESTEVALKTALKLLSLRARSRHELESALERKGHAPRVRAAVLLRLEGFGYLDDAKFARQRAAALLQQGRFGARAVIQRLVAHGISEAEARRTVASLERELGLDPAQTARVLLAARGLGGRPLTSREKAKAQRLLLGRGFSSGVVSELLGEAPSDGDGDPAVALDPEGPDE